MENSLKFLQELDAEILKAELLVFLEEEDMVEFAESFVDYIEEDLSYGDS